MPKEKLTQRNKKQNTKAKAKIAANNKVTCVFTTQERCLFESKFKTKQKKRKQTFTKVLTTQATTALSPAL